MMPITILKPAFDYNAWATERLSISLATLNEMQFRQDLPIPFRNLYQLLLHYHYYDRKLYNKLVLNVPNYKINDSLPIHALCHELADSSQTWLTWLDTSPALESESIQALLNLCSHNTHHRAQAFIALNIMGITTESLDIYQFSTNVDKFS